MWRTESTSWKVYQVVLFLVVWAGWFLLSDAIDKKFSRESEQGQAYLYFILPALLVWWLMARHGRSVVIWFGLLVLLLAFVAGLFIVGAVAVWLINNGVAILMILAFPFLLLWIYLFKKLHDRLMEHAPYWMTRSW
jgi:hypothetical protein